MTGTATIISAEVAVPPLELPGYMLDVGIGGDGILERCFPDRVVGIDLHRNDVADAKEAGARAMGWLIADAAAMPFCDGSFDDAGTFFGLMYMDDARTTRVLREVVRVLKPGGRFHVWDATVKGNYRVLILRLMVRTPEGEIVEGSYGAEARDRSVVSVSGKLETAGLVVREVERSGQAFRIRAEKA